MFEKITVLKKMLLLVLFIAILYTYLQNNNFSLFQKKFI